MINALGNRRSVFVGAMSRSGGTLLYQMTAALVELRGIGKGIGTAQRLKHFDLAESDYYLVFKSEPCHNWMRQSIQKDRSAAIGTYRDPRDVAASLWRFYMHRAEWRYQTDLNLLGEDAVPVDADAVWQIVVDKWLPSAIDWYSSWEWEPIYHSRYEMVHPDNWSTFLRGVAKYIGIHDLGRSEANAIYRQFTMGKNYNRQKAQTQWMNNSTMLTAHHVSANRGRSRTFRKWLSPDRIQQVESICGTWMSNHGYRLEYGNGSK